MERKRPQRRAFIARGVTFAFNWRNSVAAIWRNHTVKPLTELPNKARDQASDRFQLLRPHLEDGLQLRGVAEDVGVPFRTVQRWVALYHKHGLAGLAAKSVRTGAAAVRFHLGSVALSRDWLWNGHS